MLSHYKKTATVSWNKGPACQQSQGLVIVFRDGDADSSQNSFLHLNALQVKPEFLPHSIENIQGFPFHFMQYYQVHLQFAWRIGGMKGAIRYHLHHQVHQTLLSSYRIIPRKGIPGSVHPDSYSFSGPMLDTHGSSLLLPMPTSGTCPQPAHSCTAFSQSYSTSGRMPPISGND